MERQALQQPGSSKSSTVEEVWKKCWSLNVPNAVKMYVWRACHNLLPTKGNLFKRGVCDNNSCPNCLSAEETILHAVWECPAATDVWGGSQIKLQKCPIEIRDFSTLFMEVIRRCSIGEVELFAVLAHRIWLRRNDVVHGGTFTHPTELVRDAEIALADFHRANNGVRQRREEPDNTSVEKWKPPPENMVKINWDAALDKHRKTIGLGIIARDERGSVLAAARKTMSLVVEPVVAESMAALHALIFCHEQGYQEVVFEGDALQVVKAVTSDSPCNAGHGNLIEDIRASLRLLGSSSFNHVRRTANMAAHELAVRARTGVTDEVWFSIPPCISDIVRNEEVLSSP